MPIGTTTLVTGARHTRQLSTGRAGPLRRARQTAEALATPIEIDERWIELDYGPLDERPVGFFLGFELKPSVFFSWLYGVLPEFRRKAIASQLMDAVHAWAKQNDYESIRFECHNQHRPMLHLAIARMYDIVGIRWDPDRGDNLVIFEKVLGV